MDRLPESESLYFLLVDICKLKHARTLGLLEAIGLYPGQPSMLRALWEEEGLTHTELARRLQVQPATITKTINRMERSGFVERKPDPEDQRVSRVYPTQAGHAIRSDVEEIWRTLEKEALANITPEEQVLLRRLLLQIRENFYWG